MIIKPKGGWNARLQGPDTPDSQWMLMQNYDMAHEEIFEQIKGSVQYHATNIGAAAPTAILVNYNEAEKKQDVLVAVDDSILKKNYGSNEFENLVSGLTPNLIRNSVNLVDKSYIPHPKDGLFEYDGVGVITKVNDILLKDICVSKETSRCFGITKDGEIAWTDDLVDTAGIPLLWPGLNIQGRTPPSDGDTAERILIFNGRLIELRTNSIWVYYILGGPTSWRPEKLSFNGGIIAPQTAKIVNGEIWFLGYSPATGRGVYKMNSSFQVSLISYDIEPVLNRINYYKIQDACAEHVGNLYKLSFALDSDLENNHSVHIDTININKETGSPCIYGLHTYGFSASAVLNTRQFRGEHLFARKHTDGARVFKVADYRTQYSSELGDTGSLIPTVLLSGIKSNEAFGKSILDETWFKQYSNLYIEFPLRGSWFGNIEILKGFENETFTTYQQFLEGQNYPLEAIDLDSDPLDFSSLSATQYPMDFISDSIQIKVSNYNVNTKAAFRSLRYDAKPNRRKRNVQLMDLGA